MATVIPVGRHSATLVDDADVASLSAFRWDNFSEYGESSGTGDFADSLQGS